MAFRHGDCLMCGHIMRLDLRGRNAVFIEEPARTPVYARCARPSFYRRLPTGGAGPDVIAETAQAALADLRAERSVELERLEAQRSRRALGVLFRVIG